MINIKEKLDLSNSRPGQNKYNRVVFEQYKKHFDNISEFIYYYKNNLKEKPKCKVCGKELKFSLVTYKYPIYCCVSCRSKDKDNLLKQQQTCLKRYGVKNVFEDKQKIKQAIKSKYNVENVANLEWVKEKKKETCKKQYGVDSYTKTQECKDKVKKTCLKHFGKTSNLATQEHREKLKQHNISKYGVDNIFKSKEFKEYLKKNHAQIQKKMYDTMLARYGVKNYVKSQAYKSFMKEHQQEFQEKAYKTKKTNGTICTSKNEELIYKLLINKFGKDNIERQYKSKEYPFACDFYIKSLELYIEYHGSWTHGQKPFENTVEDIEKLNKWKIKSTEINFKGETKDYYKNAIYVWTKLDPKKLKVFKGNKLNYKIFYNINQFYNWYNKI